MPLPLTAQPGGIPSTSLPDGTPAGLLAGKAGEAVVSELHGKYYTSNYRNRVYLSAGAAAGTTIPISSTTAPTFTLYNPIGSGVVAEVIHINVSILNATTVVSGIGIGSLTQLLVAPTSVTAIPIVSGNGLSVSNPACQLWSAATLAAAATRFYTMFSVSATSGAFPNFNYQADGTILLQPGSLIFLCGTAAQTSASLNSICWSEFPA